MKTPTAVYWDVQNGKTSSSKIKHFYQGLIQTSDLLLPMYLHMQFAVKHCNYTSDLLLRMYLQMRFAVKHVFTRAICC